jgi:hypothetical protein
MCRDLAHISILVASGAAEPKDGDLPDGARFIRKPFSAELVENHFDEIPPDGEKQEPLRQRA